MSIDNLFALFVTGSTDEYIIPGKYFYLNRKTVNSNIALTVRNTINSDIKASDLEFISVK